MFDASSVPDLSLISPVSPGFLPLQQSGEYLAALQSLGMNASCVDLGLGQAVFLHRAGLRVISRGPVWADGLGEGAQRVALRRLARFGPLIVTPERPLAGFGLLPLVTAFHNAIWPLGPDLLPRMAGKWRNRLRASLAAGIKPTAAPLKTLDTLIAAEEAQRRLRRYRSLPANLTRALPPSYLRLWQWRQAGQMAAAMCFIRHGATATYHLGWANDAARAAGVHGVMLWQAAQALWAEGVHWRDLGTVDHDNSPGLARFKLGTGAHLHKQGATCLVLPG